MTASNAYQTINPVTAELRKEYPSIKIVTLTRLCKVL